MCFDKPLTRSILQFFFRLFYPQEFVRIHS